VANYVEDQYVEFVRNEDYFRGSPHIEKINWLILSGADVIPAGLEDGSIDITANTPAADLERFIDNPDFHIYWQPTAVYCSIAVNFNRPFLTPQVLQGIAHAIDRETLVQEFLGQTAQVWDTPLGHSWLLPNPDLQPYGYDPELARQLLEEGGWDFDNQAIELNFSGADPANVVVFIADQLQKVGMNVEMKSMGTGAAANEAYYITMNWDLYWGCNSWGFDPDSTAIYYRTESTYADGKGWNTGGWSDTRLDELYELGRTTLDQEARKEYYQEAQVIFNQRLPKIVIYRAVRPWVIRNTVHDATPQYHGELPNYNAIETWWMEQ
jgi:peptide/nickel transport system substrate-binding protein